MDDIWSSGILTFDSPLKDLLDSEDYTLEDLLNEDELLQEVKGCHPQLKSFFNEEKNVAGLIQCLLRIPPAMPSSSVDDSALTSNEAESLNGRDDGNDGDDGDVHGENEEEQNELKLTSSSESLSESETNEKCTVNALANDKEQEGVQISSTSTSLWSKDDSGAIDECDNVIDDAEAVEDQIVFPLIENIDIPSISSTVTVNDGDGIQEAELHGQELSVSNLSDNRAAIETVQLTKTENHLAEGKSTNHSHEQQNCTDNEAASTPTTPVETPNTSPSTTTQPTPATNTDEEPDEDIEMNDDDLKPAPGDWLLDNITEKVEKKQINDEKDEKGATSSAAEVPILSKEDYEKIYLRYPYIACEVICCENEDILDIIVYGSIELDCNDENETEQTSEIELHTLSSSTTTAINGNSHHSHRKEPKKQSILDMLFSILYTTPPSQLDDRRAGYLEKILSVLFRTRPKAMESYLNGDHLLLLDHLNSNDHDDNNDTCDHIDESDILHRGGGLALLDALFDHLHSNSITQIVQRLLMPKPLSNKGSDEDDIGNEKNTDDQNGWGGNDTNDSDDEEYDNENLITSGVEEFGNVNCNWSDGEYAINLLLERLLGDSNELDDLLKGDAEPNNDEQKESSDDGTMTRFDCAQNASEILIAIIQHSTLSSNVMKILTTSAVLSQLIDCACYTDSQRNEMKNLKDKSIDFVPANFSRHRSTMTTSMSVLESLVLQLGGYGTVPTTPACDVNTQVAVENDNYESKEGEHSKELVNDQNDTQVDQTQVDQQEEIPVPAPLPSFTEASSSDLILHLPLLLQRLSILLKHPDTKTWTCPVQYSDKPQQLLGASRLQIVRLIESLVLLGKKEVDKILCQYDCLETCLALFWDFPWCSMLHQSVANLLVHVLEGGVERYDLQHYFLYRCNLVELLMRSFTDTGKIKETEAPSVSYQAKTYGTTSDYERLLEMKNSQLDSTSASSSLDGERGSVSSSEDGNEFTTEANEVDSIPVSDDDVDAAMEQEELDKLSANPISNTESGHFSNDQEFKGCTPQSDCTDDPQFRIGYMGHVIIICQAIVHACSVNEEEASTIAHQQRSEDDIGTKYEETKNSEQDVNVKSTSIKEDGADNDFKDLPLQQSSTEVNDPHGLMTLLRSHHQYKTWVEFVGSALAKETAVQSTPLGGCTQQDDTNVLVQQGGEDLSQDSGNIDHDISGHDTSEKCKGTYTGDGDIDLDNTKFDDTEVDIAAKLMENITLPTPPINGVDEGLASNGSRNHHRRRGVLGGEGAGNGAQEFGTVVQMHQKSEDYYQYDDPLGGWQHQFPDDLAFDGKDFSDNENADDNETENDVPVLDLFTGNLNFDTEAKDNETGWANFDEGFADYNDTDDAKIIDSSPDPFNTTSSNFINDDFFNEDKPAQFDAASFADEKTQTPITDITKASN